jgi:2-polyprenyl-3-methyl-5-hydroxy-6-metoxy-1,4-benzoquinol methylase
MTPAHSTHRLRFTGSCSAEEFERRTAEHDFWYHSYYFDNGFERRGDYDIGRDIESYGFPRDMSGMSVLDIGTGSGWFATYFEQCGGDVTTLDSRGYVDFDVWGRYRRPELASEKPGPDRVDDQGRPIYYSPVSRGFWIMKDLLGLKARYVNGRVYDVSPELFGGRQFDLVFMGALLMHVRDPIGALMAARSVCRGLLVTNALMAQGAESSVPSMEFINNEKDQINWWRPNRACLAGMLSAAGFRDVSVDRTVQLRTDRIFVDDQGRYSGVEQTLYLAHARV